jgi:hypothetical protein
MNLTPTAKSYLSKTIRELRERLLRDIRDAAEADYRLSILKVQEAGLDEARQVRRGRLEEWLDERVRATQPRNDQARAAARERFLNQAVKEAGATLLNRLVLVRHMEALGLVRPPVVTGGWNSRGFREFRDFAPDLLGDETEGYAFLLRLLFDELALDLPGLFGDVGVTRLFRIPAATLREAVERLDDPQLGSAWTDDTTLGWVYQYWNDPEREALDAKINAGGKIEPHEIASKTQMFTERYMVEWLLHNSLGLTWLSMCRQQGWTPDAELVLDNLDRRRAEWRAQREAGEVALDALMPVAEGLEDRWKYFVPQPIPDDAVSAAPESIRDLKLLDPACGSGHFLVIAFDLLVELYREEARHRGESWSDRQIAESILERNLFGVDIDPRAIQIAAAGLYLKARSLSREARIRQLNLVAPALNLSSLPDDDPALQRLLREVRQETGISEKLTGSLVAALAGVDHLGTLLKVDSAVDEALLEYEMPASRGPMFKADRAETRETLLAKLEQFLSHHGSEEDLGLRLDGEQLAAGVRFVRIVRENTYDIVVGNPPYQGTSKMADAKYVTAHYPRGKADLYAAFLERGLALARPGGMSALLTMRGWMFISQFTAIRTHILQSHDLKLLGDIDRGGFEDVPDEVVATVMSVFKRSHPSGSLSIAMQPTPLDDKSRDSARTNRKRAAILAQDGRYEFDTRGFEVIEGSPIVYWWIKSFLEDYAATPKLGEVAPIRYGLSTQNNTRWLRKAWEIDPAHLTIHDFGDREGWDQSDWVPYIKGAEGRRWIDDVSDVLLWRGMGLELATYPENRYGRGTTYYFKRGIAFVNIGSSFSARVHRKQSIFGHVAGSVFDVDIPTVLCMLNSYCAQYIMESLNPGLHFLTTDVVRLPIHKIDKCEDIYSALETAFTKHEAARENSVEFKRPGPSPWRYAQDWAQRAVDRPEGEPLPPYEPEQDPPQPEQFVSFGVGVALGRFDLTPLAPLPDTGMGEHQQKSRSDSPSPYRGGGWGEGSGGWREEAGGGRREGSSYLPAGILFLSEASEQDSLEHEACGFLKEMWAEHGKTVGAKADLRTYLRKKFFDYHRKLYENRPIYFPLSSEKKTFVAWISIHQWRSDTLQTLLADHLMPERRRLEGELDDLRRTRDDSINAKLEKRFDSLKKAMEELQEFIDTVTMIADKGAPPTDPKCPPREADARFEMDLDDGVMVNSAALWPLIDPQWKSGACPKKWWKELCTAQGKKDYDWSHLAARYFPTRVDEKCQVDPSLGVAHGCFWKYHPAKAYQWELRLQDEIRPDFTIDEVGSDEHRAAFLADRPADAGEIRAKELKRREKKRNKQADQETDQDSGPLFDGVGEGDEE